MKKWMALLLACLLCWCAAGAMAETVTLTVKHGTGKSYDIYPNGYTYTYAGKTQFYAHEGAYVIQGLTYDQDTPLEFHANAYDETTGQAGTQSGQHVSYDVTFDDLTLEFRPYSTLVRFGCNEGQAQDCVITLNLTLSGDSEISAHGHPAFQYAFAEESNTVKICVQNSTGSLALSSFDSAERLVGRHITLYANSQAITNASEENQSDMTVYADQSSSTDLIGRAGKPATYTEDGVKEYWECPTCHTLYADAAGTIATTLDELTLPKLVRTDDLPKTGDSSRPMAWLALLGASCAGLWFVNRRRG